MAWSEGDLRPVGFFASHVLPRPDWLPAPQVEVICTVSQCTAEWPTGWMDRWLHNEASLYDSLADVAAVTAAAPNGPFLRFFVRMLPVLFTQDGERPLPCTRKSPAVSPLDLSRVSCDPMPAEFVRLGYDFLQWGISGPECSPLSCNGRAEDRSANRFCLLDSLPEAIEEARGCAASNGGIAEPGPYVVMELWCEHPPGSRAAP